MDDAVCRRSPSCRVTKSSVKLRSLPEEIISEARAENFEFVVFDETQREIASNTRSVRLRRSQRATPAATPHPDSLLLRPDLAPLFRQAGAAGEAFTTLTGPLGQERAYAVLINLPGRREIVAVIRGMEAEMVMLQSLRSSLLWAIPIGLVGRKRAIGLCSHNPTRPRSLLLVVAFAVVAMVLALVVLTGLVVAWLALREGAALRSVEQRDVRALPLNMEIVQEVERAGWRSVG